MASRKLSTNKPAKSEPDNLVGKYFLETERNRDGESVNLRGRVVRKIEDARYVIEIHIENKPPIEREFFRWDMRNWVFLPSREKMNLRIEAIRRR